MNNKEKARILATITEEQWEAILNYPEKIQSSQQSNKVKEENDELELKVRRIIKKMGVPQHFMGYNYICDAVILVCKDEDIVHRNITTKLYPQIAKKYNIKWHKVERNIRTVIKVVFEKGNPEVTNKIFKDMYTEIQVSGKLTNAHFITVLAEYVKNNC